MIEIQRHPHRRGFYLLTTECHLDYPIDEVFEFFSDAMNLERITPPLLKFKVLTESPIELKQGALIDYRLKIHGLPINWRTEIAEWDPPYRFADTQLRGPYRHWYHVHSFEPTEHGTRMIDRVEYRVPGGSLVHRFFVRRDVESIFAYREQVMNEVFPAKPVGELQSV